MEMFVLNSEITRLEALLVPLQNEFRLPVLIALAWQIRQRDSRRAEELAQQAHTILKVTFLQPAQRQAYLIRLALIQGEIDWLFAKLDEAQASAEWALAEATLFEDQLASADAHWLLSAIAGDRGWHERRDSELEKVALCAQRGGDALRGALAEACLARWAIFSNPMTAQARWVKRFSHETEVMPLPLAAWVHDFLALIAANDSDFGLSAKHFLLAREAALQTGQIRVAIMASTNLGEDFTKLNDHQSSLEWMQRGLSLARPTNWPRSIGACLMYTAETMRRLHRLDAAQELLDEALQIMAPLAAARSYGVALLYLGNLSLDRHDYPLALDSFRRLEERGIALNQMDFQMEAWRGQAHALSNQKQGELAQVVAGKALALAQEKNDSLGQIDILRVLAEIHQQHHLPGPPDAEGGHISLYYLKLALKIGSGIDGYTVPGELFDDIGREYAKIGRHAEAYQMTLEAAAARDRTHGELATNRGIALQVQQQTELAQAEAEHLRQLADAEAKRAKVLQRTSETLRHLSAIGQEITVHLELGAIFKVLNRHVHGLLASTSFSIYLLDPNDPILERAFGMEAGHVLPSHRIELSDPNSNAARCVRERTEIAHQHTPNRVNSLPTPGTLAILSALFVPLMIGNRILGVMTVQAAEAYAYGERERLIFRTLCAYGAIALDNSSAYRQLKAALSTLSETQGQLAVAAEMQTQLIEEKMQAEQMARLKAEEISQLKSDFLANMSHEIRTPMNAIIGMAHLTLRTELTQKQQDYVTKIHRAGLLLLGILNDVLDLSKIEAGKLDVEALPFFLDDVLCNVASVTSQRAADKGLEYLFNVPRSVPRYLIGDPMRLGQVLINLVNNAIKFTERGEIELSCKVLTRENSQQTRLQFKIRDTGIGIPPDQQARLFHAFTQADSSTSRKYGGTGLGLSISRHLVQLMGGALNVKSSLGNGACFYFDLTLELAADPRNDPRIEPRHERASGLGMVARFNNQRVLVVDDHHLAAACLLDALQAHALRVDVAHSGADALVAVVAADEGHDPYQLVLCDCQMPEMNGVALMREIIANDRLVRQPTLVLVSAFGQEQSHCEAEKIGVTGLLYKPINSIQLLEILSTTLISHTSPAINVGTQEMQFHDIKVLLAEDNDINQQIAVELLRVVGVEVVVANNGREAIDLLFAADPGVIKLVFMDLEMPEMDGHEATQAIRRDPRFNGVPIIAMTAHALNEIQTQCLKSGMQDVLTKPVSPAQLDKILAHWLGQVLHIEQEAVAVSSRSNNIGDDDLPNLPGIDNALALSYVEGNHVLYFQLLKRFRQSQQNVMQVLRGHCENGYWQTAIRDVHTIRGVAANIGAYELVHEAQALERLLSAPCSVLPNAQLEQHLTVLEAVFTGLLSGLDEYFASHEEIQENLASSAPPLDLQTAIQYLSDLLTQSDAEVNDYFQAIRGQLMTVLNADEMAQLTQAIHDYDYDDAYSRLQRINAGADAE